MRRPLALLLALVLLLQSALVGSGAACLADVAGAVRGASAGAPEAGDDAGHHHGHHAAVAAHEGAGGEQDAGPTPHEIAHCLAAACATPALAVTLAELPVPASVALREPPAEPTAPHLARGAPEPPPPRA